MATPFWVICRYGEEAKSSLPRALYYIIGTRCKKEGISIQELQRGIRRGPIPRVQSYLAWKLARELGVSLAEIGRQLGVSISAMPQILDRKKMR